VRIDASQLYVDTVTILFRVDARDVTGATADSIKKIEIAGCDWNKVVDRSFSTTTAVRAETVKVHIPRADYVSYVDYVANGAGWTVRDGDVVVLGSVSETVTSATLPAIIKKYQGAKVYHVEDLHRAALRGVGGLSAFTECIYIEAS
jgi:hypothetical protein